MLYAPSLRQSFAILVVILSVFPYTSIIDFGTYTQPYALLMGALFTPFIFNIRLDAYSVIFLSWFLFYGIVLYFLAITNESPIGPLKYLVAHLTPLLIVFPSFFLARNFKREFKSIIFYCCVIWITVAFIQVTIDPQFMTFLIGSWSESAQIVLDSGRGVLSLAPEPTTFGFHIIILAAIYYLLSGQAKLSSFIAFSSVFFAFSASSFLVLLIAISFTVVGLFGLKFIIKTFFLLLFLSALIYFFIIPLIDFESLSYFRIIELLMVAYENPELILLDASVNTRLGGLYVAIAECISNLLVPFGLSMNDWLIERELLLQKYIFLIDLSNAGLPSGYLIHLFQGGILFTPVLIYIISKSTSVKFFAAKDRWILIAAIAVPIFQFSLASPTFWLFWGVFLEKVSNQSVLNLRRSYE